MNPVSNILVSSAGRRGALVRLIRETLFSRGGKVFAVDAGSWSSACRLAEAWERVPRCTEPNFIDSVLAFCLKHDIQLIIPTIDTELPVYTRHWARFAEHGITIAVSGPETVRISGDKLDTDTFLTSAGLPTVTRIDVSGDLNRIAYPVLLKPRFGSASQGVQVIEEAEALQFFLKRTNKPIVQELAHGQEYTVNCFIDHRQRLLAAVPHLRIETRGGEVSKCITVKQPVLLDLAEQLTAALPDAWGALCFQAFVGPDGQARIIELNPRFGGGYPICHQAGANFIRLLIDDLEGRHVLEPIKDWQAGVAMTRWDDAVFTNADDVGQCA